MVAWMVVESELELVAMSADATAECSAYYLVSRMAVSMVEKMVE